MKTNIARHREAIDATTKLVGLIEPHELDQPTPCSDWDLRALLSHMIGQNAGFARAVRDGDAPVDEYDGPSASTVPELRRAWEASSSALQAAFAEADPEAQVVLRELAEAPFSFEFVVDAQLLDAAVHAWDLASALGVEYRPDQGAVDHLLPLAKMIAGRPGESPAFAAPAAYDGTDSWRELLALLGRSQDSEAFTVSPDNA